MDNHCAICGAYLADTSRMVCEKCEKPKTGGQKMANEKRLIDANALLIPKYESSTDEFIDGYRQGKIDALIEVTAIAPTVDAVEVVHGRWLPSESMVLSSRCSVCRSWVTKHAITNPNYKYCPHCGAKMDGDGNG